MISRNKLLPDNNNCIKIVQHNGGGGGGHRPLLCKQQRPVYRLVECNRRAFFCFFLLPTQLADSVKHDHHNNIALIFLFIHQQTTMVINRPPPATTSSSSSQMLDRHTDSHCPRKIRIHKKKKMFYGNMLAAVSPPRCCSTGHTTSTIPV